jgi:hypothetical protein
MERKELEMGWRWDGRKKMRAPAEREYVSGAVAAEPKKTSYLEWNSIDQNNGMSCSSRRRVASAFREDEDSGASVWELQVRGGGAQSGWKGGCTFARGFING